QPPQNDTPGSGHRSVSPSHDSGPSQPSVASRQIVPSASFASTGQLAFVPSHSSATSQSPAAARHSTPALPGALTHAPSPSQPSTVQGLPSSVHAVPANAGVYAQPPSSAQVP